MSYTQRITFEELSKSAARSGKCPKCGKRGRRTTTFTMTLNPWNKNPDGTVRTRADIRAALVTQATMWSAEQFIHEKCEDRP